MSLQFPNPVRLQTDELYPEGQTQQATSVSTTLSTIKAIGNAVLPLLKSVGLGMLEELEKRNKIAGRSNEYMIASDDYVTANEIADEYGLDPKVYRAALRDEDFPWHQHNEPWTVPRHSAEHFDMLEVAQRMSG